MGSSRWDEKKFSSKAAGKYSKERVVGQERADAGAAAMAGDVVLAEAEAQVEEQEEGAGASSSSSVPVV